MLLVDDGKQRRILEYYCYNGQQAISEQAHNPININKHKDFDGKGLLYKRVAKVENLNLTNMNQ